MAAEKTPLGPLSEINRIIREGRVADYVSPNAGLGMRPLVFATGTSQWCWDTQPASALNPFGLIQGGYLATFADEMCATAIGSVLDEGEWAVTVEMKVSFLRGLRAAALSGSARVIRRTRALAFLDGQIIDAKGEVAVTISATWSIAKAA